MTTDSVAMDDNVEAKILVAAVGGDTSYLLANRYMLIPVGIAANITATASHSDSSCNHDPKI